MQNPAGSDSGREWIEIYNNDSDVYNLTGWKLNTDNTDHSLNAPPANGGQGSMLVQPDSYVVITQNATAFLLDYPNHAGTVIDSSWNDFSNTADKTIWIRNSSIIFDNVTYPAVSEGNTSCIIDNSFAACIPTPGAANVMMQISQMDASISITIENATVNNSYYLFQVSITNKTCSAMDNITVNYSITPGTSGNLASEIGCSSQVAGWTPAMQGNYTICGQVSGLNETDYTNNEICKTVSVLSTSCNLSLSIVSDSVVNAGQTFDYYISANDSVCQGSHDITIEYWIEDLFGAYVKDRLNTTQAMACSKSVSRQWTPDDISGTEAYKIVAKIVSYGCDDMHAVNDTHEKMIVVKGANQSDSALAITNVDAGSDNESKYGEDIGVTIYVYRNITSKYSIELWVENSGRKISEVTKFHAKSKNTLYNLTLPVRLKPNCDGAYKDGTYTVIAEGLDKNSTANVTLNGVSSSFCKTVTVSGSSGGSGGGGGSGGAAVTVQKNLEIIFYPEVVRIGEEFEVVVKVGPSVKKPFSVYSYAYAGNMPVSEGFDGKEWSGQWTANSKTLNQSGEVTLINRIENGTEPGTYNLRVRLKSDKEEDVTREIQVMKKLVKIDDVAENNTAVKPVGGEDSKINHVQNPPITGLAAAKKVAVNRYILLIRLFSDSKLLKISKLF